MSRIIPVVTAFLSFAWLSACDQPFSPKTEFENLPVLQSVVETNFLETSTWVFVVLGTTYDVLGFNPSNNSIDPTVQGAVVTIRVKDNTYEMFETSTPREDTSRYSNRLRHYRKGLKIRPGDTLYVEATLPDGRHVTASTRMPQRIAYDTNYDITGGLSTFINAYNYGPVFQFFWNEPHGERHVYFMKITLLYQRKIDDETTMMMVEEVPLRIVERNGTKEPLYPVYTFEPKFEFTFEAFDWVMTKIGEGVEKKSDITVLWYSLSIVEFDVHLSRYYASTKGSLDSYSVRLDEFIYSNVHGGIGIFGSSYLNLYELPIDPAYAKKFGYRAP